MTEAPGSSFKRPGILRAAGAYALLFLAVFGLLSFFREALVDDTFITLQYVRTLRDFGRWGFYPDQLTNTATSPLNVIVTALVGLIVRPLPWAALVAAALEFTLIGWAMSAVGRRLFADSHGEPGPAPARGGRFFAVLATAGLVLNPLLLSTLGLESVLLVALFCVALACLSAERWRALGLVLGLLTLTRPEGALAVPIAMAVAPGWAARRRVLGGAIAAAAPWFLFSWIVLGSALPDTLLIKTGERHWEKWEFYNGPTMYWVKDAPVAVLMALYLPLAVLAAALWRRAGAPWRRAVALTAGFGAAHYAAYSLMRVPPYHWYLVPEVMAVTLLGALGAAEWRRRRLAGADAEGGAAAMPPAWTLAWPLALPVVLAGYLAWIIIQNSGRPLPEPISYTNFATHAQYRQIGLELREIMPPDARVFFFGEIGQLAWYSQRRLDDRFSDRFWLALKLMRLDEEPAPRRWLLALNHMWFRFEPDDRRYTHTIYIYRFRDDAPRYERELRRWPIHNKNGSYGVVILAEGPPSKAVGGPVMNQAVRR